MARMKATIRLHVWRIHVGQRHAAFLHLDTVVPENIFQNRRGKD
jgi:hypothetical protein